MASNINNYFGVKDVVGAIAIALAIAADGCLTGVQTIKKFFFGVLGKNNPSDVAPNSSQPKYQVIPHQFQNYKNEDEALKRALDRAQKNFPEEYQKLLLKNGLSAGGNVLVYFKGLFSKGVCSGVANALFDKIHRKESRSLKESVPFLNFEDIFYHHILQELCVKRQGLDFCTQSELLQRKIEFNEKNVIKITENLSLNSPSVEIEIKSDEEWNEVAKQIRSQLEKDLIHVGKDYHSSTFPESEKFLVLADTPFYQKSLKEIIDQFPNQDDFVGCLHIQNHVISFQYGKSGYYLYDAFDAGKGLFEYPDPETFFKELRSHALEDVIYVKGQLIREKNPDISSRELKTDAEELVNKTKGYFGVRPLNKINGLE